MFKPRIKLDPNPDDPGGGGGGGTGDDDKNKGGGLTREEVEGIIQSKIDPIAASVRRQTQQFTTLSDQISQISQNIIKPDGDKNKQPDDKDPGAPDPKTQERLKNLEERERRSQQRMRRSEIGAAVSKLPVKEGAQSVLLAHIESAMGDSIKLNENDEAIYTDDIGAEKPLADHLQDWFKTAPEAQLFAREKGTNDLPKGGGGGTGDSKKFMDYDAFELAEIQKKDPNRYNALLEASIAEGKQ